MITDCNSANLKNNCKLRSYYWSCIGLMNASFDISVDNLRVSCEKSRRSFSAENETEKLDALFSGQEKLDWLYSVYEPEAGGFYFAQSAVGREQFEPIIEATSHAMELVDVSSNEQIKN